MFRSLNEWSMLTIIDDYFLIDRPEKALAAGNTFADETIKTMLYYSTPIGPGPDDVLSQKTYDEAASVFLYLVKLYNSHGYVEEAKALEQKLKGE